MDAVVMNVNSQRIIIELFLRKFQEQFYLLFLSVIAAMALLMMFGRSIFEIGSLSSKST